MTSHPQLDWLRGVVDTLQRFEGELRFLLFKHKNSTVVKHYAGWHAEVLRLVWVDLRQVASVLEHTGRASERMARRVLWNFSVYRQCLWRKRVRPTSLRFLLDRLFDAVHQMGDEAIEWADATSAAKSLLHMRGQVDCE